MAKKTIEKTIENLSQKTHVISDEAQKASKEFTIGSTSHYLLQEFNTSVAMLASLFKQSKFDEYVSFLAQPSRLMSMYFVSGLLKGLGFAVGFFVMILFLMWVFGDTFSLLLNTLF